MATTGDFSLAIDSHSRVLRVVAREHSLPHTRGGHSMKFSGKARTMLVATAILAAGGLIGGGVAYAAVKAPNPTPLSASDTIYACVTSAGVIRGSGYERLNAPPPTCYLSTDTVRSWKAQGPAGALGPTGPTGLTGQPGAPGTNGMDGSTGAQGQTGLAGAAGLDGKDGAQGLTGPKGDTGSAGAPGAAGLLGYEIVSSDQDMGTGYVVGRSITCPAGKKVISGGVNQPYWHMTIFDSNPFADGTGWAFSIQNTNPDATVATLYAVCAYAN
jgi:hypothetical protein